MDLKDFVSQTLTQIIQGVKAAQEAAKAHGAEINPSMSRSPAGAASKETMSGKYSRDVEFDVALTVTEGTGTKGGIGIVAGPFALGSTGQSTTQNSSVTRVKFSVPLALPVDA
jgi:hypothetical protein